MAKNNATTWNRDDRDLLVELRTQMEGVRGEIAAARAEIKEINTGITARLLNLESNSVSKIVVDMLDDRVTVIEGTGIALKSQNRTLMAVGGAIVTLINIGLAVYFNL